MISDKRLIVIAGPTASGKTGVAIRLALKLGTEIISADSRQVYREMGIGTAKPSAEQLRQAKHHFIDTRSIHEEYDAGQYGREALDKIESLFKRYDRLILCGGSGLYIKAVLEGFDDMPPVPEELRMRIMKDYQSQGLTWLQKEVEALDPDYFLAVDQKNPQRLIRALELNYITGQPVAALRKNKKLEHPFDLVKLGLELPREKLYYQADERVDQMVDAGLFEEAERLYPLRALNALQTVGYQEIFGYLDKNYDRAEAIRLLKRNTRRYAKRQITWFRKDPDIQWFHPDDADAMVDFILKVS